MTKLQIIQKLDGKGLIPAGMYDQEKCDGVVAIYHILKLIEGGFLKSGVFKLTTKGFDVAYDLVDSGYKLTMEEAMAFCNNTFDNTDNMPLAFLIMESQKKGMIKMGEEILEYADKKMKAEQRKAYLKVFYWVAGVVLGGLSLVLLMSYIIS